MRLKPENPVLWLTDADGTELANGLALSLRDFGRFGQMLIEARGAGGRSKIPGWFIETLTSSSGMRKAKPSEVEGLLRGSELRYGFVHLGGAANRIALLGPYGNSLYLDFDRRLVIALCSPRTPWNTARA
jgi:CubicO group peptidase (beta-lactamase class C family)